MQKNPFEYTYVSKLPEGISQYDDVDYRSCIGVNAKYVESELEQARGNPFIEALPKPRTLEELRICCQRGIPGFERTKEKAKQVSDQIASIEQLRHLRVQLPINNELEYELHKALLNSYRMRYLMQDEDVQIGFESKNREYNTNGILVGREDAAANAGFSIVGYSGCGKSSALETALAHYPQYIIHHGKGMTTYPQIVYLVVQCPPNSNFRGLYKNIGTAIDRALGNINSVYAVQLDAGKAGSLSKYNSRVRELIERFSIGVIIFDEIQHLDFNTSRENSFEALLELCNETKVAFAVVGTEDANAKLFTNVRQARRLGGEIHADNYCDDKELFKYNVKRLFEFQWFDELVEPTEEMIDTLYSYSKGIIDQLVTIYIYMNSEYVRKKRKPAVNPEYIKSIVDKHIPGLQALLQEVTEMREQEHRAKNTKIRAKELVQSHVENAGTHLAANSKENQALSDELIQMKDNVVQNITMVTAKYDVLMIEQVLAQVVNGRGGSTLLNDEKALTQAVFKKLKGMTNKRKKEPATASPETIISYLQSSTIPIDK